MGVRLFYRMFEIMRGLHFGMGIVGSGVESHLIKNNIYDLAGNSLYLTVIVDVTMTTGLNTFKLTQVQLSAL